VLGAVLAGGCGGNGDSDSGSAEGSQTYEVEASTTMTVASPPITKAQFVKRLNKICRKAWVTVRDNFDEYSGTQNPKLSEKARFEEAARLSLLAGLDFHIFDNVRFLGAPKGERREIERIIGPFQASVELGQKERWDAHSVAEVATQFADFNALARQYGLDDCLVNEGHLGALEA
jgi:hypothetical protein